MKFSVMRLTLVGGLLALSSFGAGCDSEPQGSCTARHVEPYGDTGTNEVREVCNPNSTASACAASDGKFDEGDNCFLFDLFHPPT
ncbi:MAG: hypothetical protein ABIS92_10160 [Polyangia bacterium]